MLSYALQRFFEEHRSVDWIGNSFVNENVPVFKSMVRSFNPRTQHTVVRKSFKVCNVCHDNISGNTQLLHICELFRLNCYPFTCSYEPKLFKRG